MLSAFTARPIIELRQRDKTKIESILAHGDRVYVGLNTGTLRIYRLNELPSAPALSTEPTNGTSQNTADTSSSTVTAAAPTPPASLPNPTAQDARPSSSSKGAAKPTDLLREVERFSTRGIEQLAMIKEANVLVSLSNYSVSLHSLQTFEPVEAPLARTKNASVFATTSNIVKDPATGIPEIISRLAVAVKRRLLLWSWHDGELDSENVVEVVLAESIRSLTWASATKIVAGMNAGYVLVDVLTSQVEEIAGGAGAIGGAAAAGGQGSRFGAYSSAGMGYMGLGGYMPKPLAAKLADGEMLLAKDINTLFTTDEGKPLEKRQIPWQSAPESIAYSYPYILALQPPAKGLLEVRNPVTLSLLQTISLAGAAQLHFPPPNVSLAHAYGKGFHISSERCVWKMSSTDYDTQVEELVAQQCYDEAISILDMLEDALLKNKTETLREVKMLKAERLFRQRKYLDSMDLFNEEDVHAPPERVFKFFPRSIVGELSGEVEAKEDTPEPEEEANGKTNGEGADPETAASPPKFGGGFTKMFLGHKKAKPDDTASIKSATKTADTDDAASIKRKSTTATTPTDSDAPPTLEGKDLVSATEALNSYLAGTRARLQRVIDPSTGRLKPRKSESGTAEEAFATLLSASSASQSDKDLEAELKETFRTVDTTMFRVIMLIRPQLASSLFRIPNFCDPAVVNERLLASNRYTELVDFFHGKKLHREALELLRRFGSGSEPDEKAPSLHGPQRTVVYLQSLPPEMVDLILEFAEWTLRKDPELGMEVFVTDSENAETLPRDKVVKFLEGVDPRLEAKYLEHVITELNDMTPEFHDRLVELLIGYLKSAQRGEEWDDTMERLLRFLRENNQCSLGKALGLVPKDDPAFYEARAVILCNVGSHKQALSIYVFDMKDYIKAEEYCNRIQKSTETDSSVPAPTRSLQNTTTSSTDSDTEHESIYTTLLSLYLTPPAPHKPNLPPALDLLSKHGSRLPASSTLELIPDSLAVSELESYFRGRIRAANSVVYESRIETGLRKIALVGAQALLSLGEGGDVVNDVPGAGAGKNRRVVVTDERQCGVCNKRLGGSVIAVLPSNGVVHYGCLNKAVASTGGRPEATRAASWGRRGGV